MPAANLEELANRLTIFAEQDCRDYSPLYERLSLAAAGDPEVLGILARARPGQRRPVLLFAAVHYLLLNGLQADLAQWYPLCGGRADLSIDPYPAFRALCIDHRAELLALIESRATQTNEVARCAALLPAVARIAAEVDRPLALVELGASAGLNLLYDRYAYRYGAASIGGPSPLTLECEIRGPVVPPLPTAVPEIGWRKGIDLSPVDVTDDDDVLWLRACIFADQTDRADRLAAAVALARSDPPVVVRGDMNDGLPALVRDVPEDHHLLVLHSWVLTYLLRDARPAFAASVDEVGRSRDLDWLSAEWPGVVPGLPTVSDAPAFTVIGRQRWRSGHRDASLLGHIHPHGMWLHAY